jgi:hypothetical protein
MEGWNLPWSRFGNGSQMTPEQVLAINRGLVVAPAGCGKTYLLTETVRANTKGRVLVLTHTRAGVAVIRNRLGKADPSAYRVDTLDHWAAWIALRFPATSGYIPTNTPNDYDLAKRAAVRLLAVKPIRDLLAVTYCRVLVDEYQDCGRLQHEMVQGLATALPTVALGDPMQRVFGFRGQLIAWQEVEKFFGSISQLDTPHRWNQAGEEALGTWILRQRENLRSKRPIDLRSGPSGVTWVELTSDPSQQFLQQIGEIPAPVSGSTLLVINGGTESRRRREIARHGVRLAVVERADLPELGEWAERLEAAHGLTLVREVLSFAQTVMTGIAVDATIERLGTIQRGSARSPATDEERLLISLSTKPSMLAGVLTQLAHKKFIFRPELYDSMRQAALMPSIPLSESIRRVQGRRAADGRQVARRAIGSTLLLKGLECDHAVVLDADNMSANDLYVSLSRACHSVKVISRSPILPNPYP